MELDQIDLIDAQAFERSANLIVGRPCFAFAGFGGKENLVSMHLQPRTEPEFRFAIAGGGIDVVDPGVGDQLQRPVGICLRHVSECGGAKNDATAGVARAAEFGSFDHDVSSCDCRFLFRR